jgi:ABC-type transporter MlaC component
MKKIYILVMLLVVSIANAKDFTEKDIRDFITNVGTESQKILNDKSLSPKQVDQKYKEFSDRVVDSEWVARFILGTYWNQINNDQRKEFQELYREFLLENYMPKLKDYNTNLKITKITKQRDTVYMVDTITKDKNNTDVNVRFRIGIRKDNIYITDIIPEGVSFIGNQRSDVGYSISKDGYNMFIEQLRTKIR